MPVNTNTLKKQIQQHRNTVGTVLASTLIQEEKQLSAIEKDICNTLVKDYDDTFVRNKVMTWWNNKFPTKQVMVNSNIYDIDLVGVDDPNFGIEVEHSLTWKSHERPKTFKAVRIPIRKSRYWLSKDSEAIFIQINKDATSCVVLTEETIRNKFYNRIVKTSVGYKEHFLEYYTWDWYDLTK